MIEEAYLLAGMSYEECEEIVRQYATSYGLYTGEAESGKPLFVISRNHPELIVNDALKYAEVGNSERVDILLQMGIRRNEPAAGSAMVVQLDDDPPALQCEVYEITLIWCDLDQQGQPIRKKTTNYISKTCWDDVLACPTTLECTGDDVPWYTIFHIGQCEDLGVPAQRCVYISWDSNPTWVDCDEVDASCACFYETAPINCELIEKTCAHPVNGPEGCPGSC